MTKVNSGSFFLRWVMAVTVTMILATMGAFVSMWSIGEWVAQAWGDLAGGIVAGGIFGALLAAGAGVGQAIVLRSQGISLGRWVGQATLAGLVGMAIGFAVMFGLFDMDNMPEIVVAAVIALSVGLPVSLVQWQQLKPSIAQAQLWVPIFTAAFFVAFLVGLPLGGEGREWVAVGAVALLTAVLSGVGMVWLLRDGETAVAA